MGFHSFKPSKPLSNFIDNFWHYENYSSPCRNEKILPTGTFELVFNLLEDEIRIYGTGAKPCRKYSGAVIAGPYGRYFASDAKEETSIMGVHFKPGGAFPFLGIPAREFSDSHVNLNDCWRDGACDLHEQLILASKAYERFQILERHLLRRFKHFRDQHYAVAHALSRFAKSDPTLKIRNLFEEIGISERRFITVFESEVGITPKLFGRIQRFQAVRGLINTPTRHDWAQVALESGYFDQSHLIRDFTEFSGISPTNYWRTRATLLEKSEALKWNHLPFDE